MPKPTDTLRRPLLLAALLAALGAAPAWGGSYEDSLDAARLGHAGELAALLLSLIHI